MLSMAMYSLSVSLAVGVRDSCTTCKYKTVPKIASKDPPLPPLAGIGVRGIGDFLFDMAQIYVEKENLGWQITKPRAWKFNHPTFISGPHVTLNNDLLNKLNIM